jgi:mRNA-degrading endonuclease RelE of RelBE toxin-antitoxin system
MWLVEVAPSAARALARTAAVDRRRLEAALTRMQIDPFAGDIRRLLGQGRCWRRRVGDWRIIFSVKSTDRIVSIESIVRRSSMTY